MRELRKQKIITVDQGYGNMKTANTVTTTGIKAYETARFSTTSAPPPKVTNLWLI